MYVETVDCIPRNRSQVFEKTAVLNYSQNFKKKISLFFNKAAGERSEILSKNDSDLGVCLWISQSFNRRLTEGLNPQVLLLSGQETAFDMLANLQYLTTQI